LYNELERTHHSQLNKSPKNGDEAQTKTNEIMATQVKTKPINTNCKEKLLVKNVKPA
jgi:hypothetical protein